MKHAGTFKGNRNAWQLRHGISLQSIGPSETMTNFIFAETARRLIRQYARQHAAPQDPSLSDVVDLSNVEANDTAGVIELKVEIGAEGARFVGMKVSLD